MATPLQQVLSNSSIFHWGKHPVKTDMMYDNVSFHPNLVPLTLSSSLMPPLPLSPLLSLSPWSLTKHMPTASATCLAKKASEQTTPPTVAWRWFYQTHPAKATIMVSWRLLEEAITHVMMSHSAIIFRLFRSCAWLSDTADISHYQNLCI